MTQVVVVGATGVLGESLVDLLADHGELGADVVALASARSAGKRIEYSERRLKVLDAADFGFTDDQLVYLCVPATVAADLLSRAAAAGARVIDFSGTRADLAPSLPWIDAGSVDAGADIVRVASSACAHAALSLYAIQTAAGIADVSVNVLQSVSARGRRGVEELAGQAARLLNVQAFEPAVFPEQIAFNAIPDLEADDSERADLAVLLGVDDRMIGISRTWVSVFHGQVACIDVLTREAVSRDALIDAWSEIPQLEFHSGSTLSPVADGSRGDVVNIGGLKVRERAGGGSRVSYWSVTDDVRFASAANGIAVGEILIKPGSGSLE